MFRIWSAMFRVKAAFGEDVTIGVPDEELFAKLLRKALESMRTNFEYLSPKSEDTEYSRLALKQFGFWRSDPGHARVRDPESLRQLPPELRAGWQQFWNDVEAVLSRPKS